jgi:hypothetical protein
MVRSRRQITCTITELISQKILEDMSKTLYLPSISYVVGLNFQNEFLRPSSTPHDQNFGYQLKGHVTRNTHVNCLTLCT